MAHTVLGIDLGSESVKVAHLSAGFRRLGLLGLYEQPVPPPAPPPRPIAADGDPAPPAVPESLLDRQLAALATLCREHALVPEVVSVALRDSVTLRLLTLPLSDPRKLEQVLPFELEGQTLAELEGQVITHVIAQTDVPGGEDGPGGTRVLSATAPRANVEDLIQRLSGLGLEPRLIGAEALSPAALLCGTELLLPADLPGEVPSAGSSAQSIPGVPLDLAQPLSGVLTTGRPPLPVLLLDIGAESSQVCVVGPAPTRRAAHPLAVTFARSLGRGGRQLTAALARALGVDPQTAEVLKREVGLLDAPPPSQISPAGIDLTSAVTADDDGEPTAITVLPSIPTAPRPGADRARVAAALRDALRPFLRDLRQTLASYATEYGESPRAVLLSGGGSLLPGLAAHLAEALELPVAPLRLARASFLGDAAAPIGAAPAPTLDLLNSQLPRGAVALSLALAAAESLPQVNFRKGDLAYKTDYSFLRERAPHLIAAGLAVLLCAGLTTLASLRQLQRENEVLEKRLRAETASLFREPRLDGQAVSNELRTVIASARGSGPGIPNLSAFDLLDEISRAAPAGTLDIVELNIRAKKTDIKATAGSAQYVDDFAAALAKVPCFKDIEKGKLLSVNNMVDGKPVERKQFTLTINSSCP